MTMLRKITLWIMRLLGYGAALLVALLAVVVLVGGFTSFGGSLVADWVASAISSPDRTIAIAGPGPLLSGNLRVPSIVISDTNGAYAEIRDLSVDWSPSALLSGTFEAKRVAAAAVEVKRQPVVTEVPATTQSSGFSLPVAINIEAIDLPLIQLGKDLLGKAATLTAKGSAKADNDAIAATVALNQQGAPDARLNAELLYAPADNRLKLNTTIVEPQGGILATLLHLQGAPAVSITLAGDGPLSDWQGQLSADVAGQRTVAVTAAHKSLGNALHHILIEGNGQFDALLPPQFRPMFSGQTQIDLAATVSEAGQVTIETGNIATGSLQLSATGKLDTAGQNDLKVNLNGVSGPVDFRWPLSSGELRARVTSIDLAVTGPANNATVAVAASLPSLEIPQAKLNGLTLSAQSDAFDIASQTGTLQTRLAVNDSTFTNASLDRAIRAPLTINVPLAISPETIGFDGLTIESASIGGKLNGNYQIANSALTTDFQLHALPDTMPEAIASKFSDTVGVAGSLVYAPDGPLTLSNLKVTSSTLSAAGDVSLDGDQLSLKLDGEIADIGRLLANAGGSASFALAASGPLDRLEGTADFTAAEATMAGRALKDLSVGMTGVADQKAPQATVKASGSLDGQQIRVDADLVSADGQTKVPALAVTVGDNKLDGALQFSADFVPQGALNFDFPDIGLIAALAGQTAGGDLKGSVTVRDNAGQIAADIKASGSAVSSSGIIVTAPAIDLKIQDVNSFAAQGTVRAEKIAQGANGLDNVALTFARAGAQTDFDLSAAFDGAPVAAKGNVTEAGDGLKVALESLSAAPRGIALKLAKPAAVSVANGAVSIDALTIAAGTGTLDITGTAATALDLSAKIQSLPAALANTFVPSLSAEGSISGTVTIKGTASAPVVDYQLDWSNAAIAQTRSAGVPPATIAANGRFENGTVTLDSRVSSADGLVLQGGGSVDVSGSNALAMKFTGNLPFGVLAGPLSQQGFVADGAANLDIGIAGTTAAPLLSGTISTQGARLVDVRRNLAIEDITSTVTLDASRATISNLSGKLASGGTIKGSGTIDIVSQGLPADITIDLNKATYVDGTMLNTEATGTLTLQGPLLSAPVLAGKIALGDTAITVPERLPSSLAELDITHKNAPADVRQQMATVMRTEDNGSSSSIGLDLQISTPSQVFVRGRGIDAVLGGDLTIRGTSASPSVSGAFTLQRGRMSILTKRLDFTSGTITFGGGLIPLLNLVATTTSGTTTVTVTISGLANDPSISLTSSPSLPQDEILAQLIFGQSMSKLSALQIAQLADAASQLAGGRSTSLFSSLRNAIGVDDLDISTDKTGQATISAGKYLNDRTYLELQQGGTGGGKAVINLDIGRGVKLRGEAGGDGGAAGIFYEKEY
ncbi:MAG: translocation/assembly module TamB domain-containing protein [Allorhizobium sp.]